MRLLYQLLRNGTAVSEIHSTNTEAPQGSVISPVLFAADTNDCRSKNADVQIIKYADVASILVLQHDDEQPYRGSVA